MKSSKPSTDVAARAPNPARQAHSGPADGEAGQPETRSDPAHKLGTSETAAARDELAREQSLGSARPLAPDGSPSGIPAFGAPPAPPSEVAGKRAEKSRARREAILAAALDEFTERGFALTRMDDVARRAGVGKGTIYLHFKDKEALFQQLVIAMLGPIVAQLQRLPDEDKPVRAVLERLLALFAKEVYGTKRREVLRLVMTEGPRFPPLAEFYYRHVVEPAIAAVRGLLDRACARGELRLERLIEFPQLVVAPALVAVIWSGLFDRFEPLDMAGLMRAHLDLLFAPGDEP